MLLFRIAPHSAPHKAAKSIDYMKRDNILARQLERCKFKVGDEVRAQTSRGKKWGVVEYMLTEASEMEWKQGTQPFFIGVRIPIVGPGNAYGSEIVELPMKRLRK